MKPKFNIELPKIKIDSENLERINRKIFTDDKEKDGILAKCFIFCYLNEPCSVTDIHKRLNSYYQLDIDRSLVFRALKRLVNRQILSTATSGDVLSLPSNHRDDTHKLLIVKHHDFLENIPDHFRKKFQNVNYFWVSNGDGIKYITWCCKLLNFKCDIQENEK